MKTTTSSGDMRDVFRALLNKVDGNFIPASKGMIDSNYFNRRIWSVFGPEEVNERAYAFEVVSGYDGTGITETVNWLVDVMERSKQTKMLRVRAGIDVSSYH
ncbi:hypothetical protein LXL04_039594 [Taraxacum kok-saghyz]